MNAPRIHTQDSDFTLWHGDALQTLQGLPEGCVDCCVTSPPYWGLRDYGHNGQLGLEATPDEYVARLVDVFREVRRCLADTGSLWLNLGDSYAGNGGTNAAWSTPLEQAKKRAAAPSLPARLKGSLKPKDLVGIPWRVAFALKTDGWYLRSDIIWSKPNPMPESVTDRPTKAHEYVFLLSKSPRYWFDQDAVREAYHYDGRSVTHVQGRDGSVQHRNGERWPGLTGGAYSPPGQAPHSNARGKTWAERKQAGAPMRHGLEGAAAAAAAAGDGGFVLPENGRNVRSVWEIATQPYPEAHFAVFPEELARRCIIAGCPEGGTVLDPFGGSGTTALVARKHGRRSVLIELNETYCDLAARRLQQLSLLSEPAS